MPRAVCGAPGGTERPTAPACRMIGRVRRARPQCGKACASRRRWSGEGSPPLLVYRCVLVCVEEPPGSRARPWSALCEREPVSPGPASGLRGHPARVGHLRTCVPPSCRSSPSVPPWAQTAPFCLFPILRPPPQTREFTSSFRLPQSLKSDEEAKNAKEPQDASFEAQGKGPCPPPLLIALKPRVPGWCRPMSWPHAISREACSVAQGSPLQGCPAWSWFLGPRHTLRSGPGQRPRPREQHVWCIPWSARTIPLLLGVGGHHQGPGCGARRV